MSARKRLNQAGNLEEGYVLPDGEIIPLNHEEEGVMSPGGGLETGTTTGTTGQFLPYGYGRPVDDR